MICSGRACRDTGCRVGTETDPANWTVGALRTFAPPVLELLPSGQSLIALGRGQALSPVSNLHLLMLTFTQRNLSVFTNRAA